MSNHNEMIPENEKHSVSVQAPTNSDSISKIVKWIAILIVAILIALVVFRLSGTPEEKIVTIPEPTPQITVTTISTRISNASDLVTAKMSYTGLVDSSDGNIPIINKKHFLMTYHATVSVGYDLSNAAISVDDANVIVTMPALNEPDINVDTDSISFFNLSSAIFNWTKKEDGIDAVSVAKDQILATTELVELKKQAQTQADVLLRGILEDVIGNRHLEIKFS